MDSPTVITHNDLDGLVSYLVLCWFYNKDLPYLATTPSRLEQDFDKWCKANEWGKTTTYFLDLDVTSIGERIDAPHTIIFDHHKTNIYPFQHATTKIVEATSCCKLLYSTMKAKLDPQCNSKQKTLVALADDWDSNSRTISVSEELNIVLNNTQQRTESFIRNYKSGFVPFDKYQRNIIALYKKERADYLKRVKMFAGEVEFEGQKLNVGAVFCDKFVSECCDMLLNDHSADIAIAVMVDKKRIAVRRSKTATADVSAFVQRIANGGGHEVAAGGELTEQFMEFSKLLRPIT